METSQGNSLCSYFYLKQKCHFFSFFLSSTKLENRRVEQVLWGRVDTSGREEVVRRGGRRMSMVQKHAYIFINAKMIPVETVPGIWEGRVKENGGRGEFKYDIFDTL
jgi:hypothetical protein